MEDPEYDPRYFEKSVGVYTLAAIFNVLFTNVRGPTIDLAVAVEACKFIRKIADTSPLKDIIGEFYLVNYHPS